MTESKFLKFQTWWLEILGLWSYRPRNFIKRFYTGCIIFIQLLHMFSCLSNLNKCNGNLYCCLENATYSVIALASVYSYLNCLVREKLYKAAAIKLHEIVNQFKTDAYTNPAERLSRKYAMGYTVYLLVGILQYGACPLLDYNSCLKRDNTDSAMTCGLPSPGSFPFDSQKNPGYEAAFVFQWICAGLCVKLMAHMIVFCLSMTYHAIAQLKMLKDNLQKIYYSKVEKRCNLLRYCVKHHIAILDFAEKISTPLNEFLFVHAVLLAVILTVLGFQIMRMLLTSTVDVWNLIRYITILLGFLLILLVMSTVGQMLINESMEVAESAYNIPWYDESLEFQQMIQFIILRSQKALVLRSATVSELSFPSFTKVISSTYSYLTLLYNTVLATDDN